MGNMKDKRRQPHQIRLHQRGRDLQTARMGNILRQVRTTSVSLSKAASKEELRSGFWSPVGFTTGTGYGSPIRRTVDLGTEYASLTELAIDLVHQSLKVNKH